MTDNLDLFNRPATPAQSRADQMLAAFAKFHRENPHVWNLFERFALAVVAAGRTNYSTSAIIERIRWHTDIETRGDKDLKICNNHRAYYSRLFHLAHPEHAGFFRTRKRRSEDEGAFKHEPGVDDAPPGDEATLNNQLKALL